MLPYMPLVTNYWPFIVTGIICYIVARIIYHISAACTSEEKETKEETEEQTPDQGKKKTLYALSEIVSFLTRYPLSCNVQHLYSCFSAITYTLIDLFNSLLSIKLGAYLIFPISNFTSIETGSVI